jgi:hypothetical protein
MMEKRNLKKIIRVTLTVLFFSFILLYAILNTRLISRGIDLSINGIENGKIYTEGTLEITGNAKRAKHVLVNGREISVNQQGDFKDYLVLLPGYNIMTISAEDKFGKITQETFDIVREVKEEVISLESSS